MAMSDSIRKELAKSRELLWFFLAGKKCCFCNKPLLSAEDQMLLRRYVRFGNGQTPVLKSVHEITQHHYDENHDNNSIGNIRLCHSTCHKSHHAKLVFGSFNRGVLHTPKYQKRSGRQSGQIGRADCKHVLRVRGAA